MKPLKSGTRDTIVRGGVVFVLAAVFALGDDRPVLNVVPPNTIRIDASPLASYQLQSAESLSPPIEWNNVGSPRARGEAGTLEWAFEPVAPRMFFRVVVEDEEGGISQELAEAVVTEEVIRPDTLESLVLGFRWPTVLEPGEVIRPLGQPAEGDPKEWTVTESAYFFVIDHAPAQKLGHPFTYVLVARESGTVTTLPAFYPPEVGDNSPLDTLGQRWTSAYRFYPGELTGDEPLGTAVTLEFPPLEPDLEPSVEPDPTGADVRWRELSSHEESSTATSTVDCTETPGRKVAVVVASGADDEIQNDARDMDQLLSNLGFEVTSFNSATDTMSTTHQGIRAAAEGLGPCDKFFLYISSHTQLVDDNDDGLPDQTPIRLDYGIGHSTKTTWSILPRHPAGASLTASLLEVKAGTVNIMLDTCFAEAVAVLVRNSGKVLPPGVEWKVFASSSATKTSAGATNLDFLLDYNNDDVNSRYTDHILSHVEEARSADQIDTDGNGSLSIQEIEAAFLAAQSAVEAALADGQMPQFDTFTGPVPTATEDTFTVPATWTSTVSVAENDILVPGVRFILMTPPSLHSDLWEWDEETGEMEITGLSDLSEVGFSYKIVVDHHETGPVDALVRFDPMLNIATEGLQDPDDPNLVRVPCLVLGNLSYPVYQFRLANNPADVCQEPHWHAFGNVFAIDVPDNEGQPDPNPSTCGFGIVTEVPQVLVSVDKDTWEQFKIDHIPPIN